MITNLQLEQADMETATLKAQLEKLTKVEGNWSLFTDAMKKEVAESQAEAEM